ncbi:MAG: biotin/lipoyl-binding protein [Geminicoccaceae bacterium]|nr:MAG: biotin/lipoyl-binding protein [Geminicoccaceae bacterium]
MGALILFWQLQGERGPRAPDAGERAVAVRVVTVEQRTVTPRAVGFGVVAPSRSVTLTAETAGRVMDRAPELQRGRVLAAGTEAVRLDDADLALVRTRTEAELERLAAEVRRIEVRRDNALRALELERRALRLAEVELERQRDLLRRGTTSRTAVDQAETNYLARLDRLQTIEASLAEIEPELAVRAAERRVREAELAQAELDLRRTRLLVPFDARVAEVMVEAGQYVARGQALAELDAIDHAEIDAQFALSQLRPLIPADGPEIGFDVAALQRLPELTGLQATVRLRERDLDVTWPATFERPSDRLDTATRTLGLIVRVDDPYARARPGVRPPLIKNMHVEVRLEGRPQPDRLVVPIEALRDVAGVPHVFVADPADRLDVRAVELDAVFEDLAVLHQGVRAGERVVVGPLAPAIAGMRLAPSPVSFDRATRISEVQP